MNRILILIKAFFAPMSVAGVMSDFNLKLKQLEAVAAKQRKKQAKEALKIQKAVKAQGNAETEEANAHYAMKAIRSLVRQPEVTTLEDIKKDMKK